MRLAFVSSRYDKGVVGGAEAQVRELAEGLAGRGHEVTVLTTGALDADTWQNEISPGVTVESGVEVHRFEALANPDRARRDALDHMVLAGELLSADDELAWVASRYEAPDLARHVAEEAGRYDAVVYAPCLTWSTLHCLPLAPERSIFVPCLHDEPAARLRVVRAALAGAAEVWFNSEPEHELAHRLVPLGVHRTIGEGVPVPDHYDAEGFRRRHGLERPFVLYAGRREDGKGWPAAVSGIAVATGRLGLDLDLVTIGAGQAPVPPHLAHRVVDLGRLDLHEVPDAFAAAVAHVQPSTLESFSRTVMESWLAGTVVVGNAASAVVSWHCERSGGGFLYGDELEMAECFKMVLEHPALAADMAERGRRYVLEEHLWPPALDRAEAALDEFVVRRRSGAMSTPEAAMLTVRSRAAAARARARFSGASGAPSSDVPLGEWIPAPGLGVPSPQSPTSQATGAAALRARLGRAGRAGLRRTARAVAGRASRRPGIKVLVRAARTVQAARRAWSDMGPVAPPRDVR